MKLPIHLDIEANTVWTTYKQELQAVTDVATLKTFVERWKDIYPFKIDQIVIDDEVLKAVKEEKLGRQDMVAANIALPLAIFHAMQHATEYNVPLNTAFIQGNGGLGAFQEEM